MTFYFSRNRHCDFVDIYVQGLSIPMQMARANREKIFASRIGSCTTFCHRPSICIFAVERDIEATKIIWMGMLFVRSRPCVIWRKHTAHKGNDGQTKLTTVAQCVNIPPEVATRLDRLIELRCAITAAPASLPDIAAIGTPGPGCTLPPARNRPGI